MRKSKLLTAVVAALLMFTNVACACAPALADMGPEPVAHHHGSDQNDAIPCVHQNCEGCADTLDSCATADYSIVPTERDTRSLLLQITDLDGPDLDQAYLDTSQLFPPPPGYSFLSPRRTLVSWATETPIRRKDQLTE